MVEATGSRNVDRGTRKVDYGSARLSQKSSVGDQESIKLEEGQIRSLLSPSATEYYLRMIVRYPAILFNGFQFTAVAAVGGPVAGTSARVGAPDAGMDRDGRL